MISCRSNSQSFRGVGPRSDQAFAIPLYETALKLDLSNQVHPQVRVYATTAAHLGLFPRILVNRLLLDYGGGSTVQDSQMGGVDQGMRPTDKKVCPFVFLTTSQLIDLPPKSSCARQLVVPKPKFVQHPAPVWSQISTNQKHFLWQQY